MQDVSKGEKPKKGSGCFWWSIVIPIISILALLTVLAKPCLLNAKRSAWESRAKTSLLNFGENQSEYQRDNPDSAYASWEELQESGYYAKGYNRSNLMENYSVWTKVFRLYTYDPETGNYDPYEGRFITVAFPRTIKPAGYLATFAIYEDQVVREYKPDQEGNIIWDEDEIDNGRTWEPIR